MNNEFVKGAPMPKTLGACVDLYKKVDGVVKMMQKDTDEVKSRRREIEDHLIQKIGELEGTTGVAGETYRAQVVTKPAASVRDWDSLYGYIMENQRFDLLNKSVSQSSVKEMWENQEDVPGVERVNRVTLSVRKL